MYGQIFYFIVMGNFLSTTEVIHRRYDIKGSGETSNAPACVLGEEHYPDITLRDNDLKKRLKLDPDTAVNLVKQLTRDSNYLASAGIMDYSLLIGTHYSHFTITTEYKRGISRRKSVELTAYCADTHEQRPDADFLPNMYENRRRSTSEDDAASEGTRPSESSDLSYADMTHPSPRERVVYPQSHAYHAHQVSGPSKYYFGLVDILQEWTVSKQMERAYKVRVLRKSRNGVSAIPPKPYARRFQRKMQQLFITMPTHPLESVDDDVPSETPEYHV
ncbi:Phosphatidylinositol-4-phosphate-5-kinase (Pi-PIPKD10) [Phytophthora palmivora]|uniref:Phosphatidylinositol-4-phosphate-5-kinase (Pi-PIPKD10) n=1 Tax=Phytophthora palmivora TaxID=4796 RepID=A0A2P4X8N2_9STRA|nr:Phosphatidylinositol-4-phosphate-5-kinase (Pi-PIPKD10) [Phytophthora palmivora]